MNSCRIITILFLLLLISGSPGICEARGVYLDPYVATNYKENKKISEMLEREGYKPCFSPEEMIAVYGFKEIGPNKDRPWLVNLNNIIRTNRDVYRSAKGWYEGYINRCNTKSLSYRYELIKCVLIGNNDFSFDEIRKKYLNKYGTEGFGDVSNLGIKYLIKYHDRYIRLGIEKIYIPNHTSENIPKKYALIYRMEDSTDYIVNEIQKRKK